MQSLAPESTQPAFGTHSTISNPFSDSHEASSLADVDVGNLEQVEMTVFESAAGGQLIIPVVAVMISLTMSLEAAVVLGLHGRDGSTQEVAGMIPFVAGSDSGDSAGDSTDSHAAVTNSIDESVEDLETTFPIGAAGMGVPVNRDDVSEYFSCIDNPDLAAGRTGKTLTRDKPFCD